LLKVANFLLPFLAVPVHNQFINAKQNAKAPNKLEKAWQLEKYCF